MANRLLDDTMTRTQAQSRRHGGPAPRAAWGRALEGGGGFPTPPSSVSSPNLPAPSALPRPSAGAGASSAPALPPAPPAPAGQATRWASGDDWLRYQATITELYIRRKMTLARVVQIMRDEHHFTATPRMYKRRFKQWGLRKNSLGGTAQHRRPDASRTYDVVWDTGHDITGALTTTPTRSRHPLLIRPRAPDTLRAAERMMVDMQRYVRGALDFGPWRRHAQDPTAFGAATAEFTKWYGDLQMGYDILMQSGLTAEAFGAIQGAFDQYVSLVRTQDPRLFAWTMLLCTLLLLSAPPGPELLKMVIRYAANTCLVVYGAQHPLQHIFATLSRLGVNELRACLRDLLECYFALLQGHLTGEGDGDEFGDNVELVHQICDMMFGLRGGLPTATIEPVLRARAARLEADGRTDRRIWLKAKCYLINFYEEKDMLSEAHEAITQLTAGPAPAVPDVSREAYLMLSMLTIAYKEADHRTMLSLAAAVLAGLDEFNHAADKGSRPSDRNMNLIALQLLEKYLRELGKETEAEDIHRAFEDVLEGMSNVTLSATTNASEPPSLPRVDGMTAGDDGEDEDGDESDDGE